MTELDKVGKRPIALFDFDGTLVRGDCVARHLRELVSNGPLRRAAAMAALPVALPLFGWWRSMVLPVSYYSWLGTVGRSEDWLIEARQRYLAACTERRERLLIQPALVRLQEHLAQGHRVVVVTGAEVGLASQLWRSLGGPEVEFVGSRLRRCLGGWVAEEHCIGPRKLAVLARAGLSGPFAAAYTDSALDLPLLLASRRPTLVEPAPGTLSRVRQRLPEVEVLGL